MNGNPYASPNAFAGAPALAEAWERATFIRKTYLHLGLAILAFTGLECALMVSPLPDMMMKMLSVSGYAWLAVLGVFMLVGWMARAFACSEQPLSMQYIGLGLYVVAQAIIFVPLLTYAIRFSNPDVLPTAAVLTLTLFAGLTGVVLVTRKDFSFLRSLLMVGGFVAIGLIICSVIFGFNLGIVFSGAMVLLAAGAILYTTSKVLHDYGLNQYVGAALELFAAVALLFWYVLRIVMALRD